MAVTKDLKKKTYLQLMRMPFGLLQLNRSLIQVAERILTGNPNLLGDDTNAAGTSLVLPEWNEVKVHAERKDRNGSLKLAKKRAILMLKMLNMYLGSN
jgi:hypothetical protein